VSGFSLLLAAALGIAPPPEAPTDAGLTARLGQPARRVDASDVEVFGLSWRQPVVTHGLFRTVGVSFGRPGVSTRAGLVVVGTGEGQLIAFRLHDGSRQWTYESQVPFETAVTIVSVPAAPEGLEGDAAKLAGRELAIASSRDGALLALDVGTGKLLWRGEAGGDVRAPGVLHGTTLIVATASNRVTAVDVFTGKPRWSGGRPSPTKLTIVGHAKPLLDGNTIYAAFSDGYVMALDATTGAGRWARPFALKGGEFSDADADPVLVDGRLFIASYSDGVFALDPTDGHTLWSRGVPAACSLGVHGDLVLVGSGDGWLWGFRQATGALAYRTRLQGGFVSRMEVRNGIAVFSAGDSGLVVLDAHNGRPLQANTYGSRMMSEPVWTGDDVALLSSDGYLYELTLGRRGRVR
jgi:outer membrane protein assembly factor BamB